jgi:hypothetical protein
MMGHGAMRQVMPRRAYVVLARIGRLFSGAKDMLTDAKFARETRIGPLETQFGAFG